MTSEPRAPLAAGTRPAAGSGAGRSAGAARATLAEVLRASLALLHPFTPFQTEVLWRALHERLGATEAGLLVTAAWPEPDARAVDDEIGRAHV